MKTNVTDSSLDSYHDPENAVSREGQRQRVIAFIVSETKAGRPTSRTAIAEYFYKIGFEPLTQKSSVARAVNEIVNLKTVWHEKREYKFEQVEPRKHKPTDRTSIEHFCLILLREPSPVGEQQTLFNV